VARSHGRLLSPGYEDTGMVRYWIFVSLPYSDFNRGTISETINKIKESGKWRIGKNTLYRNQLSKGDKVLLYEAGDEGKKFVGSAELLSGLEFDERSIFCHVAIGQIELWTNPVPIRDVLDSLSFIKNKSYYGFYLRGGIVRLSKDNFEVILTKARHKRSRRSSS